MDPADNTENNNKLEQNQVDECTTAKKRGGWTHGTKRMEQRLKVEKRRAESIRIATEIESLRVQNEAHRLEMELKKRELEELQKKLATKEEPKKAPVVSESEDEDCRPPPPKQIRRPALDYDLFVSDRRRVDRGALY